MSDIPTVALKPQVVEGKALLFNVDGKEAFYNNTQIFNRDFSMLAAHTFLKYHMPRESVYQQQSTILDALSATGLRALRYAQEMQPAYTHTDVKRKSDHNGQQISNPAEPRDIQVKTAVLANDIAPAAIATITFNSEHQQQPVHIEATLADANALMRERQNNFTIIDLDPYGNPSFFQDAAIHALQPGGLLAATATDGLVTCGRQPVECLARYGCLPAQAPFCHEASVRIVIGSAALACARQRSGMRVLCSFYHAHYLRVFVQVDRKDRAGSLELFKQLGNVNYCKNCGWNEPGQVLGSQDLAVVNQKCSLCGKRMFNAGPMWMGPLGDEQFINQLLTEIDAETGLKLTQTKLIKAQVQYLKYELGKTPFYLDLSEISSAYHVPCLPQHSFVNYCKSIGRYCIPSGFLASGVKTDATADDIQRIFKFWFNVMTCVGKCKQGWEGQQPQQIIVKREDLDELCISAGIKNSEVIENVKVELAGLFGDSILDLSPKMKDEDWKRLRDYGLFEANPEKYWGPKKMI